MMRLNTEELKGLVNCEIGFNTEIIWLNYRRAQIHDTDIPSLRVNFRNDGIHPIKQKVNSLRSSATVLQNNEYY